MDRTHTSPFVVKLNWKLGSACNLYLNPQRGFFVAKFLPLVLLCVLLEFGAIVGILYLASLDSSAIEAETETSVHKTIPPHRSDLYREWYLQSVWDIHSQTPDSSVLAAMYRRSDAYIHNHVTPRTGEDFETAKIRILSPLGPDPTDLEIHTLITLEAYAVNRCAEQYNQRCYTLDFTHWAIASHILAPLGRTTAYADVVDGYYSRPWENWTIPRP